MPLIAGFGMLIHTKSRRTTFETAFLSLARFIKEYDVIYPSEKNTVLLEQLKKIWSGLFHQNWKESPLAFDFFTHAPKIQSYSYELAKDTVSYPEKS